MTDMMENREEDLVKYRLFPLLPDELEDTVVAPFLEEKLDSYLAHLSQTVVGYIWQHEPFNLRVCTKAEDTPAHLYGQTNYGDNVEDEWFIVHLLYQLTTAFPDLVAKIQDSDGEFLLIEAANSLPKWVKPETVENRVYIYNGELHIIAHPNTPADIALLPAGEPSHLVAVKCIRDNSAKTLANKKTQADIQSRISRCREKIDGMIHRGHCYIPASLAAILDDSPALVAQMVHAFYQRDPTDMKACVTFHHFRPGTRVMRQVRFTKCLYAQLMQQRFTADKRSGWTMPAPSSSKFKAYELGMKLAHGAEILCSKCLPPSTAGGDCSPTEGCPPDGPRWKHFVHALAQRSYFMGELEGSKLFCKLLDNARRYFINSSQHFNRCGPGERLLATLDRVTYDIERMREEEKTLGPADDDSWLEVSPGQLDDMLRVASQSAASAYFDSAAIANKMAAFVNTTSSHEGAEFPQPSGDADIEFDTGSFMQNMEKMFEFSNSEDSSSSGMSEYESDEDVSNSLSPSSPQQKVDGGKATLDEKMAHYMKEMDAELASTTIGESFQKQASKPPVPPPRKKKLAKMAAAAAARMASDEEDDDIEHVDDDDFRPVDVDLNAVKNLLHSYNAQQGLAGPTSNILGSMGVNLPQDQSRT